MLAPFLFGVNKTARLSGRQNFFDCHNKNKTERIEVGDFAFFQECFLRLGIGVKSLDTLRNVVARKGLLNQERQYLHLYYNST